MTPERSLVLKDSLYGESLIESPIFLNIEKSASMQRLKGLNQYGIPDNYYHKKNFSRYEHSLGVMLLLRHLGASDEEQIAGLLHDVSHRSFSHVYDWVIGNAELEDTQDNSHGDFILQSGFPSILERHGYDVNRIIDYHHFGLLERASPDLCADRIDYALREFDPETARQIFFGLTVVEGQIVTRDFKTAAAFGREYLALQINHWGGYEATARYHHFSNVLKLALERDVIRHSDFLENDEFIIKKLENSTDAEILDDLNYLKQKPLPIVDKGVVVHKKFRYIDPPFLHEGILVKLSTVDSKFVALLEEARESNRKGVLV
jgi:hypothetical protein